MSTNSTQAIIHGQECYIKVTTAEDFMTSLHRTYLGLERSLVWPFKLVGDELEQKAFISRI